MTRIFIVIFLLINSLCLGQDLSIKFFSKEDKIVPEQESYYFKVGQRIPKKYNGTIIDSTYIDSVKTFYTKTNTIRSEEFYTEKGREGTYIEYYENKQQKEKGVFKAGNKVGYVLSWYKSGVPFKTLEYSENLKKEPARQSTTNDFRVINYGDSTGTKLVINGNGYCNCFLTDDLKQRSEGKVKNGLKDSTWQEYHNDTLSYREIYDKGDFVKGESFFADKKYTYTVIEQLAEFKGGVSKFMHFVVSNSKYPKDARRVGATGQVYVSFVVQTDGTVSDVKAMNKVYYSLETEAERVIKLTSRHWSGGLQRGRPVKVKYVLPVNFKFR